MPLSKWYITSSVLICLFNIYLKLSLLLNILLNNWEYLRSAFPGSSAGKESTCSAGDPGLIPGWERSPGEGKGLPTPVFWPREFHGLYSPWGHKELDMTQRLSLHYLNNGFLYVYIILSCFFQVLEMLQRFKDSTIKREREVFNCMLRNLFEEYRFFPQYPDKELHITACLFGGIIEKGLVTYMALGLALRYVLEALRKPFGSKMYYFGIAALDRFKNRWVDRFSVKVLSFNERRNSSLLFS